MIAALAIVVLSVTPDINMELGYGRTANRVGKPSSELVRLRVGIKTEDSLSTAVGLSFTVPTTMPTSIGVQAELKDEHSNLWAQLELGYTAKHFMIMGACGWWLFGAEVQARNTGDGAAIALFGKVSFSLVTLYDLFNSRKNDEAKRSSTE